MGYLLTVACPCGVVFEGWGDARGCNERPISWSGQGVN